MVDYIDSYNGHYEPALIARYGRTITLLDTLLSIFKDEIELATFLTRMKCIEHNRAFALGCANDAL